ncbi:unnamed protein product [Zymoseptoria tritici ST99CH_3D7]|uniref:Uncharacterized protein n=1 Tax=Zymoseptoria tritici (strain ST99CH_3D7) TaxID=1276538 RepID=A0A1X7S6R6_ZYMT9|nr:unnamed protein product [Zymoseptoria tritici ST99CH_3D7]
MQAVAAAEAKFTVQNAKKITRITPVTKSAPTSVPMVNAEASKGAKRAPDGNDDDELFVRTTPLPQKRKTFSAKPSQPLTSGVKPLGAQTKTISSTKAGVQPGQTISQYTISRHDWEAYIKSTKKEIGFVHKPAADCKESIVEIRQELIREIHEVTGEDHPYWYCVPRAHRPPNKPFPDNPINANSMLLRAISISFAGPEGQQIGSILQDRSIFPACEREVLGWRIINRAARTLGSCIL